MSKWRAWACPERPTRNTAALMDIRGLPVRYILRIQPTQPIRPIKRSRRGVRCRLCSGLCLLLCRRPSILHAVFSCPAFFLRQPCHSNGFLDSRYCSAASWLARRFYGCLAFLLRPGIGALPGFYDSLVQNGCRPFVTRHRLHYG